MENLRKKLLKIKEELSQEFVERDDEIHGLTTAIISNANLLFLGPPGVSKSLLVKMWQRHIKGAKYFFHLLSPFTVPEELAGPVSLKKLQEDRYVRNSSGMLTEAHLGFLDEVWKSNSGVLNFILPILNERIVSIEGRPTQIPLLTLVGASNEMPEEDDHLDAAVDRFTLKYLVNGVEEKANFIKMMKQFLHRDDNKKLTQVSLDEVYKIREHIFNIPIPDNILLTIYKIVNKLDKRKKIQVSARVVNQSLRILQAHAFLSGHTQVEEVDLDILQHAFWNKPEHHKDVLSIILEETNPDKERLEELMTKATERYDKVKNLTFDGPNAYDESKIASEIIPAISALSNFAKKMDQVRQSIREKGKDDSLAKKYIKKIQGFANELNENTLGTSLKL